MSNTTGYNNSAQGVSALQSNTTGIYNSAQGVSALYNNTTGSGNSAQGANALQSNTTGYNNSAQGVNALYNNTTGIYNSAQGVSALYNNTTGSYNSAQGISAGRYIADGTTGRTTGNNGTYLGYNTKSSANGTDNETVIGYNAIGNGSNTVTIGSTAVTATYINGQTQSKSFATTVQTLTDGASISWDMASGGIGSVTLAGNRAIANPSNIVAGGRYTLIVTQDATGTRTLTYGSYFKFPGAITPTLSSTANAVDLIEFTAFNSTVLYCTNFVPDLR